MLRRVIRISIYSLLGAIGLVLLALAWLYHHTPDWYRPPRYTDEQSRKDAGRLMETYLNLDARLMCDPAGEPIVFPVSQDDANRYLNALPHAFDRARFPGWLSEPMVVFQPGRMILAGRVRQLGNRPVSLHLKLGMDGRNVVVAIESVNVGSLPLPRQMIEDQLGELSQRIRSAGPGDSGGGPAGRVRAELLKLARNFIGAAVDGEPMPREFLTRQTKRAIRVEKLELLDGRLLVTFVPQGPAAPMIPEFED